MDDGYYISIPKGFNCGSFRQSKVSPKQSLDQTLGVNEKLFKDANSARISESVVTGLTGAISPNTLLAAGKVIKNVTNTDILPSKMVIKEMLLLKNKVTDYEFLSMHKFCRIRSTNILEDMLYDQSDWSGSNSYISSINSSDSMSSY